MNQPVGSVIEDVETWSGKGPQDENFPVGSIIIARKYREPMHRYYTFARNADDIANSSKLSPHGQARTPRRHGRRFAWSPAQWVTERQGVARQPRGNRCDANACN